MSIVSLGAYTDYKRTINILFKKIQGYYDYSVLRGIKHLGQQGNSL